MEQMNRSQPNGQTIAYGRENMMRILGTVLFILLWWAPEAKATCTGASPTWNAASAARTDVADCVTAAASGDTVNVPAGAATWASSIDLTTKNLVIAGAGNGTDGGANTVITGSTTTGPDGNYNCFTIGSAGTSSTSRVTNFRFISCSILLYGVQGSKPFRIDHNYFQNTSIQTWTIGGYTDNLAPQGLIDHNTHERTRFVVQGTLATLNDGPYQHHIWADDPDFGGPHAVYIEDNKITTGPAATDCNQGGRYVFRFNITTTTSFYQNEVHGVQGLNRACQRWEIYGNTMIQAGTPVFTMAYIRGGSGYMFGNTLSTGGYENGPALKVERATESKSPFGFCDGSWIIDGNVANGYPCRDQIGRAQDDTLYIGTYNGASGSGTWPAQPLYPAYFWNNLDGLIQKPAYRFNDSSPIASTHNKEERDFYNFSSATGTPQTVGVRVGTLANRPTGCTSGVGYWATDQGTWNQAPLVHSGQGVLYKCVAANTWALLYTPYTYPHPLQSLLSSTTAVPPTPTNLTVR